MTRIYVNFGWSDRSKTHINLLNNSTGYNTIDWCLSFDFSNIDHVHSDNYHVGDKTHCGCNLNEQVNLQIPVGCNTLQIYWMSKYSALNTKEQFTVTYGLENISSGSVKRTELFSYTTNYNSLTLSQTLYYYTLNNANYGVYIIIERQEGNSKFLPVLSEFVF